MSSLTTSLHALHRRCPSPKASVSIALVASWLVLGAVPASAQILNTLRGFSDEDVGWSGEVEARFSLTGGNTEVLLLTAGGRAQWKGEAHRWRLIVGGTRGTSQGETFAERTVAHIRHNYRFGELVSSLFFVQHQSSLFQRLRSRFLVGLGARLDVVRREAWGLSLGLSSMFEAENIRDEEENSANLRLSSFISAQGELSETVSVDFTSFIQPRPGDFSDLRAVASGTIRADLGAGFSVINAFKYEYDADPPEGVDKSDWDLASGLGYRF